MASSKWDFDVIHSHIGFAVRHLVISKVRGQFTKWGGSLELDPQNLTASKVEVTIEAASIDTHEPQRDGHLRSPDFFEVDKYPQLTFTSTSVEQPSEGRLLVHGDLTIHGVTKAVVLDTEYGGTTKDPWGGDRVGFSAATKISRKEFGLVWNQVLETGGIAVGDAVDITLEVEAKKV